MALRTIREFGDEVLNKECKEVTKMTLRTKVLINDMLDTMYEAMGVGLAAPQVGILKRIVVIDIGEGPIVLINPVILETSGEQTGEEGCLSLPGKAGIVTYTIDKIRFRVFITSPFHSKDLHLISIAYLLPASPDIRLSCIFRSALPPALTFHPLFVPVFSAA